MPEWFAGASAALGAAIGAYLAIRVEFRFVWKAVEELKARVMAIELAAGLPRRRWNDTRARVRSE